MPESRPVPDDADEDPVLLPIEDWLDLHPFAPRDIPALVSDYLEECVQIGRAHV